MNDVRADGAFFGPGFYGNKTSLVRYAERPRVTEVKKKKITFLIGSVPGESMGRGTDERDSRGLDRVDDGFKC